MPPVIAIALLYAIAFILYYVCTYRPTPFYWDALPASFLVQYAFPFMSCAAILFILFKGFGL